MPVRVDTIERCRSADPYDSLTILVNRAHERLNRIIGTVKRMKAAKRQRLRSETGDSHSAQAGPDTPLAVREQALHIVLRDAVRIGGIIAIPDKSLMIAVESEHAGAAG